MLEIGFVVVVIAGAAVVIGRLRSGAGDDLFKEDFVDLPCPWCQAPTRENDTACPSCAHPFGRVTRP